MDESTERRAFRPAELRFEEAEHKTRLVGLAVPYNSETVVRDFKEKFLPGAFAGTLAGSAEVRANVEHDPMRQLGRRSKGTVELQDRPDGLYVAVTLPDTTVGRDAIQEVRAGLMDGFSIEFRGAKADWQGKRDDLTRVVREAELSGVALTGYPIYPQTAGTLALRSMQAYLASVEGSTGEKPPEYDPRLDPDLLRRKQRDEEE